MAKLVYLTWVCGVCLIMIGQWTSADEPRRWSQGWWAGRAEDPPGTRKVYRYGKEWPDDPRPTGRKQHWLHAYHHAHYWPHPYNQQDESLVRSAMQLQAAAGWQTATTLSDYHFNPETHELNSAGINHLYWIVTSTPAEYRTVYVGHATSQELDQVRLARVQQKATELSRGQTPPIVLCADNGTSRPAVEIEMQRRLELQSMPKPRLEFTVGTGAGSGAGATGSGVSQGSNSAGGR